MKNKRIATPELIVNTIKLFPLELQRDLLYGRGVFGSAPTVMINEDNERKILYLDTEEKIKKACEYRYKDMLEEKRIGNVFYYLSKPNRLQVFDFTSNLYAFQEPDYSKILKNIWVSTEFPHQHPIPKLIKLFQQGSTDILMTDADRTTYENLPQTVTIYRGLPDKRAKRRGLSWTTHYEKAEWFAKRFNTKTSSVLKAQINKKYIFMYTDERNEHECVINPRGLKQVQNLTLL